ncbi:glutaredoxin family protein [Tahibacter amnicola]|uniref:Glutaredoxin family protein n=1 Tax=Tahibacter amnicola TaxID=2976241 RepID=A0ABY6BCL3_9GAMM|nr:glutaredoxin family protein [Tahibacter amnicola]UXI67604.1 glutaredoxin family protein [Tahibacter amnicola]
MAYILYSLDDCHLCEEAAALAAAAGIAFESVDIGDDAALDERYGVRIPVLRDTASGRELDWPFDSPSLARFLAGP